MRILFVVRDIELGGAGKQLSLTANELCRRGHTVGVFTYNSKVRNPLLADKVNYYCCENLTNKTLSEYLRVIPQIRRIVRKVHPDVLISWRANAGCFSRLATIGGKCKVIFSERTDPYLETSPLLKVATRICCYSDGGVFQTSQAQKYYRKLAHKSIVIPNPYVRQGSFDEILPFSRRRKEIAYVARFFLRQKRQDVMLDAFKIVIKSHPDYKLVFYGDGEDMDKVKGMAEDKGLGSYVEFKGAISNVVETIRQSRVFVLSSDYEGIPNVILESFEAGTPVASTDCSPGGVRVLVDNNVNGLISPAGDSARLAENVLKILEDDDLSIEFARNSRIKLKSFSPQKIFDMWEQYLINLVGNEK